MAIALECTVCLILIGLYNPATCHQIIRSLCLETAVEFMYNHEKCKFDFGYAQNSLKDKNSSCQTKCEVKIESLKDTENTLWEVGISFGSVVSNYWSQCRDIEDRNKLTMFIACPKWNTVKIPVGGYCKLDEQCQGIEHSGVCKNERCVCRAGYVLYNLECHEVNLALNQACSFSEQCSGSPYVSCLGGKCSCIDVEGQFTDCIEIKVPIGGYCKQDEQCQGIEHSGVCKNERCVCRTGYVSYNLECHEGNLALNQPCFLSEQCSGSPYAICLEGKCSCIKGYTAEGSYCCVQIKVPVGGYCTQNEQCQGSKNSGVCEHERCVCRTGYILFNLECYEGNLALNQSCIFSEQCSGSPYASCLGRKCSCIVGYTAENSTDCVQRFIEEAKIGTTLGALFGGLLLGGVLTTVAVVIIYKRSKTRVIKREELNVTFADNNRYSLAKIVDHGTFQNIQTKDKKQEVSPYACSEGTSINDNVYGKPRNGQTQDDVYNHLHEQVKQDDVDYYDHACAASTQIGDMGDYSHLVHTTS